MKAAGIISEFNPFHNGHQYLIESVREQYNPDAVVCVMSGNFVQRGAPAMWDKFERAESAVRGGADLVLELPVCYAVNGASEFGKGGIRVLKGLGCVDYLAFGSESANSDGLQKSAELLAHETEAFKLKIKNYLSTGLSYAESYASAAADTGVDAELLSNPNDLLAIEYLKHNILQDAGMRPVAVLRRGAKHNSNEEDSRFRSASWIRDSILGIKQSSPISTLSSLSDYLLSGNLDKIADAPFFDEKSEDRFFNLIRYKISTSSAEELSHILEVNEGLENALKKAVISAENRNELIAFIKTKRYTYAKISRILIQMLLGITKSIYQKIDSQQIAYAKVLAFNKKGAEVLSFVRDNTDFPVYSNINKDVSADAKEKALLSFDLRASDVYSILMNETIYENSDMTCIPKPFNI